MVIARALRGMWWLEPVETSVDSHFPSQTHTPCGVDILQFGPYVWA